MRALYVGGSRSGEVHELARDLRPGDAVRVPVVTDLGEQVVDGTTTHVSLKRDEHYVITIFTLGRMRFVLAVVDDLWTANRGDELVLQLLLNDKARQVTL